MGPRKWYQRWPIIKLELILVKNCQNLHDLTRKSGNQIESFTDSARRERQSDGGAGQDAEYRQCIKLFSYSNPLSIYFAISTVFSCLTLIKINKKWYRNTRYILKSWKIYKMCGIHETGAHLSGQTGNKHWSGLFRHTSSLIYIFILKIFF